MFVSAWCELQGEHLTGITCKRPGQKRVGADTSLEYSSAQEAYEHVKDMKHKHFSLFCADLKVKMKRGEPLTPSERTVLIIRSDLEALRESRAKAKSFLKVMGEDGTELVYPDSFILPKLSNIEGQYKDRTVTINEYVTTTLHLKVTAVLHGPPEVGKTPLAEAIAARFARMYQEGEEECYIVTSTPDSLRLMADEELLAPGVPIVLEELEAKDRKSHARPLTANAMKQLCGVSDGGVMSARYRDFALNRKQPRIICCNSEPQQWLNDITMDDTDQQALKKRTIFFKVAEAVISDASNEAQHEEMTAFLDEGHKRLAAKLGAPL
jgi:hypothetical protein